MGQGRINLYGEEEPELESDASSAPVVDPHVARRQGDLAIARMMGAPAASPSRSGWRWSGEIGTTNDNHPFARYTTPKSARFDAPYQNDADDRNYTAGGEAKLVATREDGSEQIAGGIGGHMYTGPKQGPHRNDRNDETYAWLQKLWRSPDQQQVLALGVRVDRLGDQGGVGVQESVHAVTGGARGNGLPRRYPNGGAVTTGVGLMADAGIEEPINEHLTAHASAGATLGTQLSSAEAKAGLRLELPGKGRFDLAATAIRDFDMRGRLDFMPGVDKTHIGAQLGISYPIIRSLGLELEVGFQKNGRMGEPMTMYVVLRAGGGDRHWLPRQR